MENDPPEIDLDFLRYAQDINESKSLKKFMENNSRERTRSRPRTPQGNGGIAPTLSGDAPSQSKRLGPEGCEKPQITSICTNTVRRKGEHFSSLSNGSRRWIESPTPSNDSAEGEMGFVRETMHDALGRLRELEEQVKTIPKLQVQISILEQQKAQLKRDLARERESNRDMDRSAESVRDQWIQNEKKLKIENEALLLHIKQLEAIVEKVNCEVRSIAAQTDFSCLRRNARREVLHIDDDYESSDSSSLSDFSVKKRKRRPPTRSVACGGFEYLENIICYDRTTLRSVGIGTTTSSRDFGNYVNFRTERQFQNKVDKSVGNHVETRTVASHAKPSTREKRIGKSRPSIVDASTAPISQLTQNKSISCELMNSSAPKVVEKTVVQTVVEKEVVHVEVPVEQPKPETKDASIETFNQTVDSSTGPDEASSVDVGSYVNWFAENSRARRVQTSNVQTISTETETDVTEMCDVGCAAEEEALPVETSEASTETEPVSPLLERTEPRTLDLDEDEMLMIFGDKCNVETNETSAGPDSTIDEATLEIVRNFTFENPQIVEEILNAKLLEPEENVEEDDEVTPIRENSSSDSKETIPEELTTIYDKSTDSAVLPKPDFGSDGYKFMTDVEEDYELPEGVYDQIILIEKLCKAGDSKMDPPKDLKREWFNVAGKPNSKHQWLDLFISSIQEHGPSALPVLANSYDANGNCALHYAVSHGNMDVVQRLVQCKCVDVNLFNKAGYTPSMLAALIDTSKTRESDKQDLTPLMQLFRRADLDLKSKNESQTALMLAASHGRRDTVRYLLMNDCDVDQQDEEGSTALMCASEHGHVDIVKLLLDMPTCDPSIIDNDGATALQIAMDNGHRDIGVLLYAKMEFPE
ncbi:Oidioi.mRNA.OKI2018_I69.XSR.g16226.t1.cds [Oikopleura dioica]|uniref:Oidioi.mRNA.OKI2018_I69.XSR.g16226.t1.cds n=1 Tax=Oikopleura dioica TaxID=34765 RepID=A0ABN7SFD8_OIKDI|nr:Oidioi.mRNA.OKI2018_I69.XSR.g16226.t1.cds [Oikopleura dioica]